jgi:hypothetical protein
MLAKVSFYLSWVQIFSSALRSQAHSETKFHIHAEPHEELQFCICFRTLDEFLAEVVYRKDLSISEVLYHIS